MKKIATFGLLTLLALVVGCTSGTTDSGGDAPAGVENVGPAQSNGGSVPVFTHSVSEYPSWSAFMVAAKMGLINPDEGGEHGTLEKKHGVDVVLKVADYDPCLNYYGTGTTDSVCITNGDILALTLSRPGVAFLPTSRSHGADQILSKNHSSLKEIVDAGEDIYLLTNSVSHTTVWDLAVEAGIDPKTVKIKHLEPGAAATAIQNPDGEVLNICVWNPFALQAKKNQPSLKVADSTVNTPGRVVDMVVIGQDSLAKPGGPEFCRCICETFYTVSDALQNEGTKKDTTVALGEDFFSLSYEDMAKCLEETQYYANPTDGTALYSSASFQSDIMPKVLGTQIAIGNIEDGNKPTISFDGSDASLKFSTEYMSN